MKSPKQDDETGSEDDRLLTVSGLAPELGRTRSFNAIEAKYQSMTKIAEAVVVDYTLFKKSLLTPGKVLLLINNAWEKAQSGSRFVEMPGTVSNIYVSETPSQYVGITNQLRIDRANISNN